jgi:hypothetical protein
MGDFVDKNPSILALPGPQYSFDYSKGLSIGNNVIIVAQEGGQVKIFHEIELPRPRSEIYIYNHSAF